MTFGSFCCLQLPLTFLFTFFWLDKHQLRDELQKETLQLASKFIFFRLTLNVSNIFTHVHIHAHNFSLHFHQIKSLILNDWPLCRGEFGERTTDNGTAESGEQIKLCSIFCQEANIKYWCKWYFRCCCFILQCRIIRTTELAAAQEKQHELERQKEETLKSYSLSSLLCRLQGNTLDKTTN